MLDKEVVTIHNVNDIPQEIHNHYIPDVTCDWAVRSKSGDWIRIKFSGSNCPSGSRPDHKSERHDWDLVDGKWQGPTVHLN